MKIKRFNKITLPVRDPGAPQIKVYQQVTIVVNESGCALLGLKFEEGGIEFIQDEDKPKDWYIIPSTNTEAFKLKLYKGTKGLAIQNSVLAKQLLKSIDKAATIAGLLIGSEPVTEGGETLWPIITSSYKPKD